jgi:hypothetical protein
MPSRPPTESPDKGAENEAPEDKVTRGNFEALTKGLFGVDREALKEAEQRFKARQRKAKPT